MLPLSAMKLKPCQATYESVSGSLSRIKSNACCSHGNSDGVMAFQREELRSKVPLLQAVRGAISNQRPPIYSAATTRPELQRFQTLTAMRLEFARADRRAAISREFDPLHKEVQCLVQ